MKKNFVIVLAAAFLFSCNDEIKVNEAKLNKINDAGKDLQKAVKTGVDTVASKVKKLTKSLDNKTKDTVVHF